MGAATSYRRALLAWFERFQARILERATDGVDHLKGRLHDHRTDSDRTRKLVNGLFLEVESVKELDPTIHAVAGRVAKKNATEIKRLVGVSLHSEQGVTAAIDSFRKRNVDLITSVAKEQLDEVSQILDTAEREAWRVEEIRKSLLERFDVTKSRAELIARDQVLKLNGQLTQLRQTNAGISEYVWTTSGDERVRPVHADLDGTTQSWQSPPVISDDGATGHPGDDYQCRCTAFPVIPSLDDQGEGE